MKVRRYIREELTGWKTWEIAWLAITCFVIFALSIYWKDTVIGMISATTGVACVACTGKGKRSAYLFGTINTLLYAFIAYKAQFYGEVMLNVLYYFPMQFYGMYVWSKHMNNETHEVEKRAMSLNGKLLLGAIVIGATVLYGLGLRLLGGNLPFIDAFSTIVSVVAMIISIKMYAEQWLLWIVVDAVTVIMWIYAFINGNESIATLLMWVIYLGNAIIMYAKWMREAKHNAI